MSQPISIERLFGGKPLISPSENWWESGVTFNSAAIHVESLPQNALAMNALLGEGALDRHPDGVVVLHYRARPKVDPGRPWTRSFVGISVHNPDLTLVKRFDLPVVEPSLVTTDPDSQGVEDPRVTFIDGAWWMAYCGVTPVEHPDPEQAWRGSVCLARSEDLVTWTKYGAVHGTGSGFASTVDGRFNIASVSNKDGVLFPDRINGKVYMLHRPMEGAMDTWSTCLAVADAPEGPYEDLGRVHGAARADDTLQSWVGAGSVPIKIGEGRYVSIEHTGSYLEGKKRRYVLDAFLYDFNRVRPENSDEDESETLVAARIDDIMRPETDFEINGPFPDSVANVVFACGSHIHDGWLYIVYGGGDSFILSARLRFDELVRALEAREVMRV